MYLEIVSPEATLFGSDVETVVLPGINGEFQILKNHASIVWLLKEGTVKIHTENPMFLDVFGVFGREYWFIGKI